MIFVTIGPRDPEFVTPFIKHLLVKRRRLRRCGRINEANAIATKINELIVAHHSKRLASLSETTTKELWASVKNKKTERQPININGKLADPEEFNSFFSAISTDSDYVLENINKFRHSGPTHSWLDDNCNIIYNYQIEPLLRSLKTLHMDMITCPHGYSRSVPLNSLMLLPSCLTCHLFLVTFILTGLLVLLHLFLRLSPLLV